MVSSTAATKVAQLNAVVAKVISEFSPGVRRLRYEFGEDWTGEPVIFFKVLLSDDAAKRRNLRKIAPLVASRITDECFAADLGLFPHVNFRSESEQAEMRDPAWA